ncbi:hypothetical protein L915_13776 [Phytophthora nicotianae]|uniref:C3H1-type domain-containing protein n=1 Tax=Phytophthora nicotianae TaxID=4792 RepID=W2GBY6_PHYNI|nr:hypothetical protein L915_13776 [Phytophthora nicotianae]
MIPQNIRNQIPFIDGTQVCVRFQSVKGCSFAKCKQRHEIHRLPDEVVAWLTGLHGGLKSEHPQRE